MRIVRKKIIHNIIDRFGQIHVKLYTLLGFKRMFLIQEKGTFTILLSANNIDDFVFPVMANYAREPRYL